VHGFAVRKFDLVKLSQPAAGHDAGAIAMVRLVTESHAVISFLDAEGHPTGAESVPLEALAPAARAGRHAPESRPTAPA
jgi:hypothetical protein